MAVFQGWHIYTPYSVEPCLRSMVLRELVVTHGFSRLFWVIVAVRHNAADHFLLCLIQTVKKGWIGSHGHNAKGRNRKTFCPRSSNIRISREPSANQPRTIDVLTSHRTADHCNAARILSKMAEYFDCFSASFLVKDLLSCRSMVRKFIKNWKFRYRTIILNKFVFIPEFPFKLHYHCGASKTMN